MGQFFVKINKEKVLIDKGVFEALLDLSPIKEYKAYIDAINQNQIPFEDLKKLALKSGIPYPLFFAPKDIIDLQLEEKEKNLYEKIPSKDEVRLTSRGRVEVKDIELIVKDLGRKQEFLKNRVLPKLPANLFIGCAAAKLKANVSLENIANQIRNFFEIDLSYLRSISKNKVLEYLCSCVERKGILISFSSHNYMPQTIDKELELSGICIRDKTFPYIFINTRDGDEKPKIIESTGRQIFTLLTMLACVAMGKFVLSTKAGKSKDDPSKIAFAIAAELIIPKDDVSGIQILTLDELKEKAYFFRVTPSMLLFRMKESKKIDRKLSDSFWSQLQQEARKAEPKVKHAPLPVNGYGKYNGERFSKEIIKAHSVGLITSLEVKNILFRRGKKMDATLLNHYSRKYKS